MIFNFPLKEGKRVIVKKGSKDYSLVEKNTIKNAGNFKNTKRNSHN